MIRFIHTADIHFGMENYGKIDPTTGIHSRLLDFERALNFCIDVAIEQNVDFFLFSGDAYKTAHPSPTQQKLLLSCFLRLHKAHIPVVIIIGNHDNPLSFGKAHSLEFFGQLPLDGFHVFAKPASLVLNTKSGPISIVGIPWPTRNTLSLSTRHALKANAHISQYIAQAVSVIIQDFAQKLDPTIPAVLAAHLTISSGIFSGSEKRAIYGSDPVLLPSQVAIPPFDYVALGHLHRYQNLNENGYPAVVYSGSPERIDFGERKEDKGFCLVTVHTKGNTTHEFIRTPTRPFIQVEVQLDATRNQTQQIIDALAQYTIDDAIVKIVYHVPPEKKDLVDLSAIQQACSSAMYLAGVVPVHAITPRSKRAHVAATMDLPTLLEHYFANKQEFKLKKDRLISKTLKLMQEQMDEEQELLG